MAKLLRASFLTTRSAERPRPGIFSFRSSTCRCFSSGVSTPVGKPSDSNFILASFK